MLNCCLEYERYIIIGEHNYTTGMPIYFDATCSGSQLISLLFKVDDYAHSLNITPTTSDQQMGDFYTHLIDKYKAHIHTHHPLEYQGLIQTLGGNKYWRKLFKHIIMTINYGLTYGGVMEKLLEKNHQLPQSHQLSMLQLTFVRKSFWGFINEVVLFKSLDLISRLTEKISNMNKTIDIYTHSSGYTLDNTQALWLFKQCYNVAYTKVICVDKGKGKNKRVRRSITYSMRKANTIDVAKQSLAIKANLIHNLDAIWIHNFIMRVSEIKDFAGVLPIHDCFGVLMKDICTLNIHVRKALYEFFHDRENLYRLLLQLQTTQAVTVTDKQNIHAECEKILGKLELNLHNSLYLIFPG